MSEFAKLFNNVRTLRLKWPREWKFSRGSYFRQLLQEAGDLSIVESVLYIIRIYSRINSTNFQALGVGKVSEPRPMPQVGRLREVVCA